MSNYAIFRATEAARVELHDTLKLTGTEISINTLPAGAGIPFVHRHTQNEEVYIVLEGKGLLHIDGQEQEIAEGDCFRIDPAGDRSLCADRDTGLKYVCIQARAGSLENFTMTDAVITQGKASWM